MKGDQLSEFARYIIAKCLRIAAPEVAKSAKIVRAYFLISTPSPRDEADGGVGTEFGAVDGEADAV